jgi:hypothetical protein
VVGVQTVVGWVVSRRPELGKKTFAAMLLSLALGCGGERAVPVAAPAPAQHEGSSSARLGYSWTLPDDWESIPPDSLWTVAMVSNQDLHAARKKGQNRPAAWLYVTNLLQVVPGPATRDDARDFETAQGYAALLLGRAGGHVVGARHVPMLGHDAIEVNGEIGKDTVSIRTIYLGYRKFEFRCLGAPLADDWACADAFRALQIEDVKSEVSDREVPRTLHLREPKLGFAFDPPDDSWLAVGPRSGDSGVQTVWIWNKQGRQIGVGVMRLSRAASEVDADSFVVGMTESTRRDGSKVTEKTSSLAGKPCHHLEITHAHGTIRDSLILVQGRLIYIILVTQPTRDQALVEAARKGFRLISE